MLTLAGGHRTRIAGGVTFLGSLDAGMVYPGARLRAPALDGALRALAAWQPDVIHSQCEFSTFAPARQLAKACGAPLVHTYHTVYEDYTHYFSPSRRMGRGLAALFTRHICAQADAVIAPTEKIRRLLTGYGVACPVEVIPTGLDLQVDDYITKPFSMPVLVRKIAAVLRRSAVKPEEEQGPWPAARTKCPEGRIPPWKICRAATATGSWQAGPEYL